MGSTSVVVDVPNREVDRMVFLLASGDRDSCLVTSKNDGDKEGSVCVRIIRNEVLNNWGEAGVYQ